MNGARSMRDDARRTFKITKVRRARNRMRAEALAQTLTPARRRVFDEILKGGDFEQIAGTVGSSYSTVRNQTIAICRRFDVSSRLELLALFVAPPESTQ